MSVVWMNIVLFIMCSTDDTNHNWFTSLPKANLIGSLQWMGAGDISQTSASSCPLIKLRHSAVCIIFIRAW